MFLNKCAKFGASFTKCTIDLKIRAKWPHYYVCMFVCMYRVFFLFYRVKNLNNFLKNGRILYTLASKCSLLSPAQFENHQKYPRYIWNEENGSKVRGRLLSRINRKSLPIFINSPSSFGQILGDNT